MQRGATIHGKPWGAVVGYRSWPDTEAVLGTVVGAGVKDCEELDRTSGR